MKASESLLADYRNLINADFLTEEVVLLIEAEQILAWATGSKPWTRKKFRRVRRPGQIFRLAGQVKALLPNGNKTRQAILYLIN